MNTPNPSKAQEWWHRKADELYFVDDYNDQDKFREGVSAIIRESERRQHEKTLREIDAWLDKVSHNNIRDGFVWVRDGIKGRLSCLPNGDVEGEKKV